MAAAAAAVTAGSLAHLGVHVAAPGRADDGEGAGQLLLGLHVPAEHARVLGREDAVDPARGQQQRLSGGRAALGSPWRGGVRWCGQRAVSAAAAGRRQRGGGCLPGQHGDRLRAVELAWEARHLGALGGRLAPRGAGALALRLLQVEVEGLDSGGGGARKGGQGGGAMLAAARLRAVGALARLAPRAEEREVVRRGRRDDKHLAPPQHGVEHGRGPQVEVVRHRAAPHAEEDCAAQRREGGRASERVAGCRQGGRGAGGAGEGARAAHRRWRRRATSGGRRWPPPSGRASS